MNELRLIMILINFLFYTPLPQTPFPIIISYPYKPISIDDMENGGSARVKVKVV